MKRTDSSVQMDYRVRFAAGGLLPFRIANTAAVKRLLTSSEATTTAVRLLTPLRRAKRGKRRVDRTSRRVVRTVLRKLPLGSLSVTNMDKRVVRRVVRGLGRLYWGKRRGRE